MSYFSDNLLGSVLMPPGASAVTFDAASRTVDFGRDFTRYKFPYRSGQGVEDLGRRVYVFTMEIPLFRSVREIDYPNTSDALIALVTNETHKGELEYIDPEFGAFDVKIADVKWSISAEEQDGGRMTLTLEERSFGQDLLKNLGKGKLAARGSAAAASDRTDYLIDATFAIEELPEADKPFSLTDAWVTAQDALDTAALSADGVAAVIDDFVGVAQKSLAFSAKDEIQRWSISCSVYDAIGFAFDAGDDAALAGSPGTTGVASGFREVILPTDMSMYEIAAAYLGDPSRAEEVAFQNPSAPNPFQFARGSKILVAA